MSEPSAPHVVEPARQPLRGSLSVPNDKSILHRIFMFGALAEGWQLASWGDLRDGDDLEATRTILKQLGADISYNTYSDQWAVKGPLRASPDPLFCRDSGTTMRLMAGVLAAAGIEGTLTADTGLSKRPMERIAEPLRRMGLTVETTDGHAPVRIRPGKLRAIEHRSAVASAQVKSCVLLAGLRAEGRTVVHEPFRSRDHTERLLRAMGVELEIGPTSVAIEGGQKLKAIDAGIPGDLSSAAFPVAAALLVPGSEVTLPNVGINPTRAGFLDALEQMGADVTAEVERELSGEPFGTITARGTRELRPIEARGELVVRSIDELPALFALAAFARGRSVFHDAQELRKKESDRIAAMARGLRALGVSCEELPDGIAIDGDPARVPTGGALVEGAGDHRIVMALACMGLRAAAPIRIAGADAIEKSYRDFFFDLEKLAAGARGA